MDVPDVQGDAELAIHMRAVRAVVRIGVAIANRGLQNVRSDSWAELAWARDFDVGVRGEEGSRRNG